MPTFAYQARDKAGQRVAGTREAPDQRSALEALREAGLFVTQLMPSKSNGAAYATMPGAAAMPGAGTFAPGERPAPERPASERPASERSPDEGSARERSANDMSEGAAHDRPSGAGAPGARAAGAAPQADEHLWRRANAKEMALFFRQMHAMIHAGTSISHALSTLGQHGASVALRESATEMGRRTINGQPWSETMRSYPGLFSELMIGMIAAGEKGGFLERMCMRLADYSERDYEIQQTIKRETWYPKLLVFCAILIPSVVPLVLASMAGGNPLLAWFHSVAGPLFVIGVAFAIWRFVSFMSPVAARNGSPRYILDKIKLSLPIGGKTVRALATAKFCRALGALQAAGAGMNQTMNLAANACGNAVIAESVRSVIPKIERGLSLTESLAATEQFPGIAIQMLHTGEVSGSIEEQLDKVADFLEADAETTIKQAVKVWGIVIFLLVAIWIGIQVMQFYTGYFNSLFSMAENV